MSLPLKLIQKLKIGHTMQDLNNFQEFKKVAVSIEINQGNPDSLKMNVGKAIDDIITNEICLNQQANPDPLLVNELIERVCQEIATNMHNYRVMAIMLPQNVIVGFKSELKLLIIHDPFIFKKEPSSPIEYTLLKNAHDDPVKFAFLASKGDSKTM